MIWHIKIDRRIFFFSSFPHFCRLHQNDGSIKTDYLNLYSLYSYVVVGRCHRALAGEMKNKQRQMRAKVWWPSSTSYIEDP